MTSGLPPAAARRRAGACGPPAVASVLSLPVWLVFVGTVLLSVVRGGAGAWIAVAWNERVANRPSAGHGKPRHRHGAEGDAPWARRHRAQRPPDHGVPVDRPRPAVASLRDPPAGDDRPHGGERRERRVQVVRVTH